jgi:hypothetical protein
MERCFGHKDAAKGLQKIQPFQTIKRTNYQFGSLEYRLQVMMKIIGKWIQ